MRLFTRCESVKSQHCLHTMRISSATEQINYSVETKTFYTYVHINTLYCHRIISINNVTLLVFCTMCLQPSFDWCRKMFIPIRGEWDAMEKDDGCVNSKLMMGPNRRATSSKDWHRKKLNFMHYYSEVFPRTTSTRECFVHVVCVCVWVYLVYSKFVEDERWRENHPSSDVMRATFRIYATKRGDMLRLTDDNSRGS